MKLKILTQHAVPPSPSVASAPAAPALLPLTYFDLYWYPLKPIQRVYFYSLPGVSPSNFLSTHLPAFKHALSLTLRRFLPLAGRLVLSTSKDLVPCLRYSHGDTVQLTVVEEVSGDQLQLAKLTADEPKLSSLFRGLAPPLDPVAVPLPEKGQPVLAFQLTLFPFQGVALGISMLHVVMDGSTVSRFMRTWSTICRCGDTTGTIDEPSFDRSVIDDPGRSMARELMEEAERCTSAGSVEVMDLTPNPHILRCTVRLSSRELENLRLRLCCNDSSPRYSSFSVATALVWTTVLRAQMVDASAPTGTDGEDTESFAFVCDLRKHLGIPQPYFGNLLGCRIVTATRTDLTGPNGLAVAASLVRDAAAGLHGPDGVREALQVITNGVSWLAKQNPFSVAGSPRLGAYGVDFGWGMPVKTEVVSIDTTAAMSLAESPDADQGGLEIGVVLPAKAIHAFVDLFVKTVAP